MTPEEFEELLKPRDLDFMYTAADGMRLADALAGLDERERKKLFKTAKAYWRKLTSGPYLSNDYEFAGLGVLAVGPLSEARKVEVGFFQRQEEAVIKLLIDRRPDWIDDWVSHKLDQDYPRLSWKLLRALVCAGVCRKPDSRGYALVMSWGALRDGDAKVRISERLMNEPDLLEDVWRFFEQDICPFHDGSEWHQVLGDLASQNIIDRQRLLKSALQSLFHDVRDDVRSGYVRFYRYLEPTVEQRAARQPIFLELLSHRASPMVAFALDELAKLEKQKMFDAEAFLTSGKSIFTLKPKGQPLAALKLAANAAKRQPELVPAAISFALEGLAHDSPDVQKHALAMLEGWQNRLHHDHFVEIRERSSSLSATARKQAEALLASAGSQIGSPAASEELPATDRASLESRVAGLDGKWRKLAGVDQALEAIDRNELPPALEFRLLDVPVLTGTEPVVPIQSVDELLDATAHAIEVMESGDEIERILDGISRLCDQRPADFELRAAPLIARMESEPEQDALRGLRNPYLVPECVGQLILGWLRGRPREIVGTNRPRHTFENLTNIHAFIDARAKEIERRIRLGRPAPMLSAPTHKFGWLEPREFVRRIKEFASFDEIPIAELILPLLRLAPDNRGRALEDASELAGDVGRAVRWALGGDERPVGADQSSFAIWLGAGRSRVPYGDLNELEPLLAEKEAAFALLPPTFVWQAVEEDDNPYLYRPGGEVPIQMKVNLPNSRSSAFQFLPTFSLNQVLLGRVWGFRASWQTQWLTSFWPLNCESRLAVGAKVLCQRVNAPASSLEPNYVFLLPLLEPDRPWSELVYLVCWIALVSKDASSRGMGVDCMIQAIDDGRAASEQAADVFIRLLSGGWVKLNRVAETLQEIARVSPYHAWWSAALVQECIVGVAEFPSDTHHLLTFLVEQLTELELPLAPRTKERLISTKFSGKSAKLVGQLLKLEFKGPSAKVVAALERALDARLARAQRWSQTCPK
jgi:hypothetical protein